MNDFVIPTILVIIEDGSEEELVHEENSPLLKTLPESINPGVKIKLGNSTYTVVEADTEPKLDRNMNVIGTYVVVRVK
jgi:hypothetical protein